MTASGTFRTSRDVQLESGMRTKADVRRRLRICGFTSLIGPFAKLSRSSFDFACAP
jgi:hypothetical protein